MIAGQPQPAAGTSEGRDSPPNPTSVMGLIKFVPFVLAIGGGFLKQVAPPDGPMPPVGVATLAATIALGLFFAVRSLLRRSKAAAVARRWELAAAAAILVTAFGLLAAYWWQFQAHTALHAGDLRRVIGSDLLPALEIYVRRHPDLTPHALLLKFGDPERIWTSPSIASARAILTLTYGLLITAASVGLSLLFDFEKKATGRPAGSGR